MSFVQECVRDSLPIWEACLNGGFLRQLEAGTLDEACFKGYIVDDSLYLREYAKVFAWGILKAETMEDIRTCHAMLSFVNEGEGATRLEYLKRYGLSDADVQRLPPRPENLAYTQCMLEAAQRGGMPECMMSALPCMISYEWIFQRLLERSPVVRETPFWPMVRDYADESYSDICASWADYTDGICAGLPEARLEGCMKLFRACSLHEENFWRMSERPRTDV